MGNEANGKSLKKISEITKTIGASRKTLQEYDRMGLVHPTAKTEGGYWLYDEEAVKRISQIQILSLVGYKRSEMKELLDATKDPVKHREIFCDAIEKLKKKREQIDGIIFLAETMSLVAGAPEISEMRALKQGEAYVDVTMMEDLKQTAEHLSDVGGEVKELVQQIMPLVVPLTVKIAALGCCQEDFASDAVQGKLETIFAEWQAAFTEILRLSGELSPQESMENRPMSRQLSEFKGFVETILKGDGSTEETLEVKLNRMYGNKTSNNIRKMVNIFVELHG